MKNITWASNKKFFQGDNERPITENEKLAIAFIAGMVAWITIERIAWYLMGNLKIYW